MWKAKPAWPRAVVACLIATTAAAAEDGDTDLPFRLLAGHLIVVRGEIGSSPPLTFVIDTGTNRTLVDQRTAATLHLEPIGEVTLEGFFDRARVRRVTGRKLRLGPIQVDSSPLLAVDLSALSAGARVDAVIGLDVLGHGRFVIDYARRRMRFGLTAAAPTRLDMATVAPGPTVEVAIGGVPARLLVDTAAPRTVLYAGRERRPLPIARLMGTRRAQAFGGDALVRDIEIGPMRLGVTEWPRVAGLLVAPVEPDRDGTDGVLSPVSLGLQSIEFDFERRRLGWIR